MSILVNLTMTKIVEGGPFELFENPVCCKISERIKRDPLETLKNFRKKMRSLDNLMVPKHVANYRKYEWGPFKDAKKSHKAEKGTGKVS